MARLSELGLTLADVDLGEIEAEADRKLAEYFVTTDYVIEATTGSATLFLGRKGSGKSAVFTQLPRLIRELNQDSVITIQVTPDQYSWAALKQYAEQGLLAEQAHTNAWKYSLAIEVAAGIADADRRWGSSVAPAIAELKAFLGSNYGAGTTTFGRSATSLIKGLKDLNLSAFGFGVGVSRAERTDSPITPAVTRALLERVEPALAEVGVVVAADRLDDSWDGSLDSHSLMVGLLKASRDLNNAFSMRTPGTGLRIVTFLRSDIYDSLGFDDKDKQRSTERLLVWTPEELATMITRRLPGGLTVDELFEGGEMRGSIAPFNYVVKRTFLRPREVLQFTALCIRVAGRMATEVSKDDIRRAEERYSTWKVEDLKQEYSKVVPHFEELLECLRQEVHRYDAIDDLSELIARKEPGIVEELGPRRILEILFETSVIGVRPRNSGSARFRSEDSNLSLPTAGAVYVHQGLHKGLRIREARA